MAQISFKPYALAGRLEYYLPWKGPAAALLNPASLSETGTVQVDYASSSILATEPGSPFLQVSAALPFGISTGIAGQWTSRKLGNWNAVILESVYAPMLALSWPFSPEAENRVAAGAAFPLHHFNAFGAVESFSFGMDIGLLSTNRLPHPFGEVRTGFIIHQLMQPEVSLPDERGAYEIPREFDVSLTWTLADGMVEFHSEFFRLAEDASEGPVTQDEFDIKNFGLEFNPTSWIGFKLERTATGARTIGTIFRYDMMSKWRQRLELDLSHDNLNVVDEGRGFIASGNLSAGF